MDVLLYYPTEVTDVILYYLSETDLCRLAQCSRGWREKTNRDWLWRPLCVARGWERYGTTVDLNPDEGVLDHSNVLIGENAETLEATCVWKAFFLKAMELETDWAEGRYHKISLSITGDYRQGFISGGMMVCDGVYLVRGYLCGITIWKLKPQEEAGANNLGHTLCLPWKRFWDSKQVLVSKGVGLTLGQLDHWKEYFVRTFDCRTGKWLVGFLYDSSPVISSYQLDGETMIGQPSEAGDLRKFCVWSSVDGTLRHTLNGHEASIESLALLGNMAASIAENLKLWDVKQGVCLRNFECPEASCGFWKCKLGAKYVMGCYKHIQEEKVIIWNLESTDALTITACKALKFWDNGYRLIDSNEFAVVLCYQDGYKVWNQRGESVFNGTGNVYLAGTRMLRQDGTSVEVWSLGPDSRLWRRLSKTALLLVSSLDVFWADETKLVFTATGGLQQLECQPLRGISSNRHVNKGRALANFWRKLSSKAPKERTSTSYLWHEVHALHFW